MGGGTKINWLEWGSEAFERAKKEDKPLLLDITAVWCYWCHRMDEDTYSNDEVAKLINEKFIPVRVDTDKRPDVNARYNQGGWPTTAVLTPSGEVIAGSTYVPPEHMQHFLEDISEIYKKDKGYIGERLAEISYQAKEMDIKNTEGVKLDAKTFEEIVDGLVLNFDADNGGFGTEPKFPNSEALALFLSKHRKSKDQRYLNMLTRTLSTMFRSELYDKVENGFFRYCTRRNWTAPHFEKMLEDQAELLRNYVEAFQVTKDEEFKKAAEGIITYLREKFENTEGGFFGSQDADEEYYKLNLEERKKKTAPAIDKTIFINWNAKMVSSYLSAYNVLGDAHLKEFALKTIEFLLQNCYSANEGVYHFWINNQKGIGGLLTDNLYFANALIDAYETLGEQKYLEKAKELADFVVKNFFDNEKGGFRDVSGKHEKFGKLAKTERSFLENSFAARFLTRLYYITDNEEYHKKAETVLKLLHTTHDYYGIFAATYALGLDFYLNHAMVNFIYKKGDEKSENLHRELLKVYYPNKIIRMLEVNENKEQIVKLGYSAESFPMAFICFGQMCMPPAMNAEKINMILEKN